jgi:hypothetical protein
MPTVWENSHVDRLKTLSVGKSGVSAPVDSIRSAIEPLIGPDAAKVLTAIAADVMAGVAKRNNRKDVNEACAALRSAIVSLEAVGSGLDG